MCKENMIYIEWMNPRQHKIALNVKSTGENLSPKHNGNGCCQHWNWWFKFWWKSHKCELNAQEQQQLAPEHPAIQMAKSWSRDIIEQFNTLWNLCAETSSIYLSIAYIYYDSFRFLHEASYPVKPSKNSLEITSQDSIGAFLLQNNIEKRKPLSFLSASSRFITKQTEVWHREERCIVS